MTWLPLVAVDPGGTTGIVALRVPREEIFGEPAEAGSLYERLVIVGYSQVPEDQAVTAVAQECRVIQAPYAEPFTLPLILESFALRTKVTSRDVLAPARVNAAIEQELAGNEMVRIYQQSPSEAKGTVTDERLRRWGLYRKGSPHARDALRHAVYFCRKARADEKVRMEAWGE